MPLRLHGGEMLRNAYSVISEIERICKALDVTDTAARLAVLAAVQDYRRKSAIRQRKGQSAVRAAKQKAWRKSGICRCGKFEAPAGRRCLRCRLLSSARFYRSKGNLTRAKAVHQMAMEIAA